MENRPFENNRGSERPDIKGWGIDADPKNDPTYPMKHRTNEEHKGYTWERPPLQPETVEILHSNERPNLTAVFGTSTPPSGVSGAIRRFAFRYSENSYGHWLPLLIADRVSAVEGVIDDLRHGYVPNIFAEKGYKGKWKHDPKGVALRIGVIVGVTAALIMMMRNKKELD